MASADETTAGEGAGTPDEGPLWLLLHELDDRSAAPLRRTLEAAARAAGGALISVPAPALMQARRWSLRMDSQGRTETTVQLGPHRIDGHRLKAVLNRLGAPPVSGTHADAGYLQQEWQAVLAFWLASLPCPVLNAAHPTGLSGPQATVSWWRQQAARAGLPTRSAGPEAVQPSWPTAGASRTRLLVLGDRCVSAHPPSNAMTCATGTGLATIAPLARGQDLTLLPWREALPALARSLGLGQLEVWLDRGPTGDWRFDTADPRPDLSDLDASARQALLACLGLDGAPASNGALDARPERRRSRHAAPVTTSALASESPPMPPVDRPHLSLCGQPSAAGSFRHE